MLKKDTFKIIIEGTKEGIGVTATGYCTPAKMITGVTQAIIGISKRCEVTKEELIEAIKENFDKDGREDN